jgi:hypothetical protein
MSGREPFVSVILPTRDRPKLVRQALESLQRQTFTDFEVIVADNAFAEPCRAVFDDLADRRFRYVTPPSPLAMHDNWEYGLEHARGEYVAFIIDKTAWLPSALQVMHDELELQQAEVVTWWEHYYRPFDDKVDLGNGTYLPSGPSCRAPAYFDGRVELERRLSFATPRGNEGPLYYRGKICFGAYRRDLLTRIENVVGRAFLPISPDYTSMAAALALGEGFIDLGRPLQLLCLIGTSNGNRVQRDSDYARTFLEGVDPNGAFVDRLPIPGLYASQHNIVAHDYLDVAARLGLELDMAGLCRRAREDLLGVEAWAGRQERREQFRRLTDAETTYCAGRPRSALAHRTASHIRASLARPTDRLRPVVARWLTRAPSLEQWVRRAVGRGGSGRSVRGVRDVQEAAALADEWCRAQLA